MANRFSIEATFKASDQMSGTIKKIEGTASRFSAGFGASMASIDGWNNKVLGGFASVAKQAAAVGLAVGGALAAAAGHIIHTGADFEQSITNVGAVMGKTRSQIGDLEKSAMSLGVTTQFSSSEVAEAMEFMARKGFDSEEILQGIPGVLNAVAASGEGMAEVATVVGSSIRGFGLEAKEAGYVANLLAFTAEKTGAKITDMGTALSIAAPTAKALGVSIDDTAAAVGLLQKTGIDASTAGSAVATMLAKISHPSKEAASKMEAMGIKFKDSEGNMLSFRDVLGQFVKAGDKAGGNMDKMSFFAELVGLRGDKAALGLERMAKSGEFDKLLESLKNTGNYAEKVAKIRLDTTEGSWKLLLSTIEVIETKLFNLVGGSLRKAIDATNKWLGTDQDLKIADAITKASFAIDLFATGARNGFNSVKAVFAPVVWLFGVFGKSIEDSGTWPGKVQAIGEAFGFVGAVGAAFLVFAGSVKIARGAVIAYEAAVAIAKGAMWAWNAAVGAHSFITGADTASTVVNTAANWGSRLATIAGTVAMGARNAVTWIAFAATTRFTVAQIASKVASIASTAVTWLWNTAQGAWTATTVLATVASGSYRTATVLSTEATGAATVATDLANMSMGTFLITLGAVAAAIGSIVWAYKEFNDLLATSGGWEGFKAGVDGALSGDFLNPLDGYNKGVDDFQNRQAWAKDPAWSAPRQTTEQSTSFYDQPAPSDGSYYGGAPQVASPTQAIMQSVQTNHSSAEVTVRAQPGTHAAVSKPAKGNIGVRVTPSGSP